MTYRSGKIFYKNLKMFLLMTLVPVIVLGTFSVNLIFTYIKKNAVSHAEQSLNQINENMDIIYNNVNSLSQTFSNASNPSMTLRLILNSDRLSYTSATKLPIYMDFLDSMTNFQSYIDSIYIYYPNPYQQFLASKSGIVKISNFGDSDWLTASPILNNDISDTSLIQRTLFTQASHSETTVITIYKKTFSLNSLNNNGIIVLNLKYSYLQNLLNQATSVNGQQLYILNSDNTPLVLSTCASEQLLMDLLSTESNLPQKTDTFTWNSNTVSVLPSEFNGYYIISITPNKNLYSICYNLIAFIILLILLSLFISFFLAYHFSAKNYKNIDYMIQTIEAAKTGKPFSGKPLPSNDEYSYIMHHLVEVFLNNDYLSTKLSEEKYRAKNMELTALQAQINPHFLSNTLETIYMKSLGLTKGPNEITELIENLSDILRYTLTSPTDTVSFAEELEYTKCYLNIQQFRYKDKFSVKWNISNDICHFQVIKLLLQPFIENAIYHGIKEKEGNGTINISCFFQNSFLNIIISDDGKGITEGQLSLLRQQLNIEKDYDYQNGIGIINTYRRLRLIYGENLQFSINSRYLLGTTIHIIIPPLLD